MNDIPSVPRFILPKDAAEVIPGLEAHRETAPKTITRTLQAKLRTSRSKEKYLKLASQRCRLMRAEVLRRVGDDLQQIAANQTGENLMKALVDLVENWTYLRGVSPEHIPELSRVLDALRQQHHGVDIINELLVAMVSNSALQPLRDLLDQWEIEVADTNTRKTLARAAAAIKQVRKAQTDNGEVPPEPLYTTEQLQHIRYVLLLRKLLCERHRAAHTAVNLAHLAKEAAAHVNNSAGPEHYLGLLKARSSPQDNLRMIDVICEAVARDVRCRGNAHGQFEKLRAALLQHAKRHRRVAAAEAEPFVWALLRALVETTTYPELESLRLSLHFHDSLAQTEAPTMLIEAAQRFCILLKSREQVSTSILLLVELGEVHVRGLGNTGAIFSVLLDRCYNAVCSKYKYPLSSVLRFGTLSACASDIVGWSQRFIDYLEEKEPSTIPHAALPSLRFRNRIASLVALYELWTIEDAAYHTAASAVIPFGPDQGRTLGAPHKQPMGQRRKQGWLLTGQRSALKQRSIGKRGARRLKSWIMTPDVITETLFMVDVLLYPRLHTKDQIAQAKQAPHPWWKSKKPVRVIPKQQTYRKHGQSIEAIRPSQHQPQRSGRSVRLGQLLHRQLRNLRRQLWDQQKIQDQLATLEYDIDCFLQSMPPRFPSVEEPLLFAVEHQQLPFELQAEGRDTFEQRYALYLQTLSWFYGALPSKSNGDVVVDHSLEDKLFDLESLAMHAVEQAASGVNGPELSSIFFCKTMGTSLDPKAFTLLFYDRRYSEGGQSLIYQSRRYIFVCALTGEEAEERMALLGQPHSQPKEPLYFVNLPERRFQPLPSTTLLFFPFEVGDDYQRRYLDQIIQRQYEAPKTCVKTCDFLATGEHDADCQPQAAIGSVNLVARGTGRNHSNWYLHIPIEEPAPPCQILPNAIVGFHEHDGRYFYALIDLQGQLLEVGDIIAPSHVGPETVRGPTSPNFAFEMAHALVRQSQGDNYQALIGIEDTSWKCNTVTISRNHNRAAFGFPRHRISILVQQKAAEAGLMPPVIVQGVAPSRDCGHCGYRTLEISCIRLQHVRECPACRFQSNSNTLQHSVDVEGKPQLECLTCCRVWQAKEPFFKCPQCRKVTHARYNTALLIARRLLSKLLPKKDDPQDDTAQADVEPPA